MPRRISLEFLRRFIIVYIAGILAICLGVFAILFYNLESKNVFPVFIDSLAIIFKQGITYWVPLITYGLYRLGKNLQIDFRKKGSKGLLRGIFVKVVSPLILLGLFFTGLNVYKFSEDFAYQWNHDIEYQGAEIRDLYKKDGKQRGMHVFGLLADTADLEILKKNNIEWLTFVPFISQAHYQKPQLGRNLNKIDSVPDFSRLRASVATSKKYGFHIMLKPHIWLNNPPQGIWRSHIEMNSEEDWRLWFKNYRRKMLAYAGLAQELKIELFCIGAELHTAVRKQPEKWAELIADIKKIYTGELTYAANWSDDLREVSFWEEMDYLGIQAYFPIAKQKYPDLEELEKGWEEQVQFLEHASQTFNKPILFTEIGYKSTPNAGIKPWEWNTVGNRFFQRISSKTQALCYQAFFELVWDKDWFAGAHIWEWQARGTDKGENTRFTVEGKPALNILAKGFATLSMSNSKEDSLNVKLGN